VGAAGFVIIGTILHGEPMNTARLVSISLILAGIIGLKLAVFN
jgi:quaternary ammonium compound-resistance protein SugE